RVRRAAGPRMRARPHRRQAARSRARWPRAWVRALRAIGTSMSGAHAAPRLHRPKRGAASGEPAEGRTRHQPGPAAIIVEEQAAHHFPGRIEAGNDAAIEVLDLAVARDL